MLQKTTGDKLPFLQYDKDTARGLIPIKVQDSCCFFYTPSHFDHIVLTYYSLPEAVLPYGRAASGILRSLFGKTRTLSVLY